MKRISSILCAALALCLLLGLTGCGSRIRGKAEDTPYSFKWREQLDDSLMLTFDKEIPEGSYWSGTGDGIVSVSSPRITRSGYTRFKLEAQQNGETVLTFTLTDETSGFALCAFYVNVTVGKDATMELTWSYGENGEIVTKGDEACPVSYIENGSQLDISVPDAQWQFSHENSNIQMDSSIRDGHMILTFARVGGDKATNAVDQSMIAAALSGEAVDGASQDIARQTAREAFYAQQDDVLTMRSPTTGIAYQIKLHMEADGTITLADLTQDTYDSPCVGVTVNYDEATGETRVSLPEGYTGWTEDTSTTTAGTER